jgi:hypothetical protein
MFQLSQRRKNMRKITRPVIVAVVLAAIMIVPVAASPSLAPGSNNNGGIFIPLISSNSTTANPSISTVGQSSAAVTTDTLVNVGSPATPFSQNKQNEPALAVDANHPNILAAGSNDEIDDEACNAGDPTTCPFTQGVGVSGIYFSFDNGASWTQPTYTGWTARDCLGPDPCVPHEGPIGTLPLYYENGLVSGGDPALAFGPVPDSNGHFSWDNGSRLYYANLTSNFSSSSPAFKGFEAVAVSRTDDVTAAAASDMNAWMTPVIVTKQSATTFSDKEQIWADNASSSPFFGHVYVCLASFRSLSSGLALPQPLLAATSTDGGDNWTIKQVTSASNNPFNTKQGFGRSGCTIRTDSNGVVYIFANQFAVGTPGYGAHIMIKSYDGGSSWTRPERLFIAVDTCNAVDNVIGRCVMDGIAGARDDLSSAPGVDIANGAPSGAGATNEIFDTWVDGRDGLNQEHVFVTYSQDGGASWSSPASVEQPGDRGYYSAIAVSPKGTTAYLVYNAFTTPYRDDTTSPRNLVGVLLRADIAADGTLGSFSEVHRGVGGDPRGSSQNNLVAEFLGDYVYAAATDTYGAAVWNDMRLGADCPALDAWRAYLRGGPAAPMPAPGTDCPANFGNSDIFFVQVP